MPESGAILQNSIPCGICFGNSAFLVERQMSTATAWVFNAGAILRSPLPLPFSSGAAAIAAAAALHLIQPFDYRSLSTAALVCRGTGNAAGTVRETAVSGAQNGARPHSTGICGGSGGHSAPAAAKSEIVNQASATPGSWLLLGWSAHGALRASSRWIYRPAGSMLGWRTAGAQHSAFVSRSVSAADASAAIEAASNACWCSPHPLPLAFPGARGVTSAALGDAPPPPPPLPRAPCLGAGEHATLGPSPGLGQGPGPGSVRSHGPGPGLPLDATGTTPPPLQRPDHLGPVGMAGPVNIADDHEDDPREVLHRVILHSATGGVDLPGGLPYAGVSQGATTAAAEEKAGQRLQQTLQPQPPPQQQPQQQPPPQQPPGMGPQSRPTAEHLHLHRLSGPDLAAVALAVLPTLSPARVAQLSVALARLGHFDLEYKAALVEHVVGRMYEFTPQQLADVAWAVAACGYYDLPFLEALAGRLRETAPQWDARSLAKVLWAFGRFHFVGREPAVGCEALEAMVERLKDEMDGSTIAEVVYAAGQMADSGIGNWHDSRLQDLVSEFARNNMTTFGPEALGKLAAGLLGLGSAGVDETLCDAVARRAGELGPRLEPEDICRVMELLASHGRADPSCLEALAARAAELSAPPAPRLAPHEASELLTAFNSLGHASEAVLALASRAYTILSPGADFGG